MVAAMAIAAPATAPATAPADARPRALASRSGRSGSSSASWQAHFSSRTLLSKKSGEDITYSQFRSEVQDGNVDSITVNNNTGGISGTLNSGKQFHTTGQVPLPDADLVLLNQKSVDVEFKTPQSSFLGSLIPLLLPVLLIIGFFVWMQRRAAGQMGNVMSIGRSRRRPIPPTSLRRRSLTSPATRA